MVQTQFPAQSFGRNALLRPLLFSTLFALLLGAELFGLGLLNTTEHRLADAFMRRHAEHYRPDPDIVVVDIDDASLTAMQDIAGLWSWPREIHADLLAALNEFGPRAVVFDISFSERDSKRPKSDALLSDAVVSTPAVYLAAARLDPSLDPNGARLTDVAEAFGIKTTGSAQARAALQLPQVVEPSAWRLGLINSLEDDDGILRRYRLATDVQGWRLPSLPARVAADLGAALPAGGSVLMRWPESGHRRFPYGELYRLLTEQRPTLHKDAVRALDALFRDKIVLIGMSATSAFDHHLTPMGVGYPGVDILAVAIDNLKNGQGVQIVPSMWSFVIGLALIALLALAFARRVNPLAAGCGLAAVSLLLLAVADTALGRNLLIPVATPLIFAWTFFLTAATAGYLRERRAREQAVGLFGRFLNPAVVRRIVDQGETVDSLSGRSSEITVLFSDIRGFTTLSETRAPEEIVKLLNRYFERQVEVVFRHGGTLDKFIGDCIMAFWGAPLDDARHAERAVAAALEMQQVLLDFKAELQTEGADVGEFDVGIGVHSGPAVVGFIGASRKLDYTAIGDTVNLASRVEGLTKGVARVLVTRETMQACAAMTDMEFVPHGAFPVKGRNQAVELYEPRRRTI